MICQDVQVPGSQPVSSLDCQQGPSGLVWVLSSRRYTHTCIHAVLEEFLSFSPSITPNSKNPPVT